MTWTPALAALAPALLALPTTPAAAQAPDDAFMAMTSPFEIAPGEPETQVGELVLRGAVEISPDKAEIGGISSLHWHDGTLFAVADDGRWLELTPSEVGVRLVDVAAVRLGPLRDAAGKPLDTKQRGDAEALTRLPSGAWLVAFEQEHRIWRYADLAGPATGSETGAAALVAGADANAGLETLAAWDGGFLACGEWADPARPNCLRVTPAGAQSFHLAAPEGIAEAGGVPTDAACKADGTCFVLLRSYTPGRGNRAAVVEVAADGAARTLAFLAPPLRLDNFEGLALREEVGRTFLYLVSDDNLRNCETVRRPDCQRTLLVKFELPRPAEAAPLAPADFARGLTGRPATRPFPEAGHVDVVIETTFGRVTVAVETERAPITAANFLRYVDGKRFDGMTFYRAAELGGDRQPAGLVQAGVTGDPRRVLPKIAHEPTSATGLTHTHGALSMAMLAPGDADGDFFVVVEDQTGFDADPAATDPAWAAGYAAFGYVTAGMDVIAAILAAPRDPERGEGAMRGQMLAEPVRIISARRAPPPLSSPPPPGSGQP